MGFYPHELPDFPWDTLASVRDRAACYPQGLVDLTIGTPVDSTPKFIQHSLTQASNAHGYPTVVGVPELGQATRQWMWRNKNVGAPVGVLPTIGSKEIVGLLPSLLGLGRGDRVGFPQTSYPTYDVGARLAGATPVTIDPQADPASWPSDLSLVWLNSPGNPDGHVLNIAQLQKIIAWARKHNVVVANDECYSELCWDVPQAPSLLSDDVCGKDSSGLLIAYSLSKQSNMAGYRAAFLAGDEKLIAELIEVRKHLGFMLPTPVQYAMIEALYDDTHVAQQREVYGKRREILLGSLAEAGLENDPQSVAGLYLWVRAVKPVTQVRPDAWQIVRACAELGIVVTPGTFYGNVRTRYELQT